MNWFAALDSWFISLIRNESFDASLIIAVVVFIILLRTGFFNLLSGIRSKDNFGWFDTKTDKLQVNSFEYKNWINKR